MKPEENDCNGIWYTAALKSLLSQSGVRFTNQRQKILEIFKDHPEEHHLSAEEIYKKLSGRGENIGISTIYRALHLMVELGFLRELGLAENKKYYELNAASFDQHHHLVCVQCGDIQEFSGEMITEVGAGEAEKCGFAVLSCQFTVYAVCPHCCRVQRDDAD
jgi:Fur family ferric uptake transcriptional regulator